MTGRMGHKKNCRPLAGLIHDAGLYLQMYVHGMSVYVCMYLHTCCLSNTSIYVHVIKI